MKRYVLTGAPGAGKTSVLRELEKLGFAVVAEAATEVIGREQERGTEEPWQDEGFIDRIVALQREREQRAGAAGARGGAGIEVHDRSVLCTLALARFLGRAVTPLLAAEVARVMRDQVHERQVFLIRPIGFVERTAARRIGYEDSLVFERLHEEVYRSRGFELVDVPAARVAKRAALIASRIATLA